MTAPRLVGLEEIRAAGEVLRSVVHVTPVEDSASASELAGLDVLLKCEHLQRTGSFKLRGAYHMIHRLDPAARARGVVCASQPRPSRCRRG